MSVHTPPEPVTCRECGALVAPRTIQCRRCGRYRDAGAVESAVLRALIPTSQNAVAGTLSLAAVIIIWALVVTIATRGDAFPAASSFTLLQFGALQGPFVLFGQYWRAGTSMFLHHDLIHLLMNLYALAIVGPLLEQLVDRYRVWSIFLLGGMASMLISHFWYASGVFGAPYIYVSAGASGAVCALIGATFIEARRSPNTGEIAKRMLMWSLFMLGIGLLVKGVNNSAHIGGWVAGATLQWLLMQSHRPLLLSKLGAGVGALLVVACFAFAGLQMRGLPSYNANDGYDRSMMLLPGKKGVEWSRSDQVHAWNSCRSKVSEGADASPSSAGEVLEACRLNAALNGFDAMSWRMLELAYRGVGDERHANAARRVALNLQR